MTYFKGRPSSSLWVCLQNMLIASFQISRKNLNLVYLLVFKYFSLVARDFSYDIFFKFNVWVCLKNLKNF